MNCEVFVDPSSVCLHKHCKIYILIKRCVKYDLRAGELHHTDSAEQSLFECGDIVLHE